MKEFHFAAEASTIGPGRGRTVNVREREFALFNVDGEFRAVDNECPHVGAPLGAGTLSDGNVICPMHGWEFDLKDGSCLTNPRRKVAVYETRVVDGRVEIAF